MIMKRLLSALVFIPLISVAAENNAAAKFDAL